MKKIKYFFEFIIIYFFFIIFKILGYKVSTFLSSFIGYIFGPLLRSKKTIINNIHKAYPQIEDSEVKITIKEMWKNYGKILSDYVFIKNFRKSNLEKYISIENKETLIEIKNQKKPVIFISGHFNNFELLAMEIEKTGINLAAVYRPLNNIFLNKIIKQIRVNYICKNQIEKGLPGVKKMVKFFKNGTSLALMIDQRVSQGIQSNLFNQAALTTTIPAQFVKKFNCQIVPMYIERKGNFFFKIKVDKPLTFEKDESIEKITQSLNLWLEKKIKTNPHQWIWSHNRWK
jgi:Kdo2-lipid IVA lauroyltransferase/acyltransferase